MPHQSLKYLQTYKLSGVEPVGEFSMGRVRQCPYKTSFLCIFLEFAPSF
jgi:hypothetical protein